MKKVFISCLALLCLLLTQCQEEGVLRERPEEDCFNKDCDQPDPIDPPFFPGKPLPSTTPKKNILDFLSQQKNQCQGQGLPEVWMYHTFGHGKGGYSNWHGIRRGTVRYHGTTYYKIDLYDNLYAPGLYPAPRSNPTKVGCAYIGKTNQHHQLARLLNEVNEESFSPITVKTAGGNLIYRAGIYLPSTLHHPELVYHQRVLGGYQLVMLRFLINQPPSPNYSFHE